jgi:hypothetical protein
VAPPQALKRAAAQASSLLTRWGSHRHGCGGPLPEAPPQLLRRDQQRCLGGRHRSGLQRGRRHLQRRLERRARRIARTGLGGAAAGRALRLELLCQQQRRQARGERGQVRLHHLTAQEAARSRPSPVAPGLSGAHSGGPSLMSITAFIGYVLPWGQMSFWGATAPPPDTRHGT